MNIDDIEDLAEEQRMELSRLCYVDDGWIRFTGGHPDIELARIATYQKLAWWTRHLAGKPWMTLPLLRHFMRLTCEYHELEYCGTL